MSLLRTIESRIARLVEGTFGRVFRTHVQPVEIARRLVKEMDDHRQASVRSVYVPNHYEVYLSRDDHRQFRDLKVALETELAEYLAEHARRNGYALTARPRVQLSMDRDLGIGTFGIATKMLAEGEAAEAPADSEAAEPPVSQTMVFASPVVAGLALEPGSFVLVGREGTFALAGERTTVGRGKANGIVLHDSSVSREHAEVVVSGSGAKVRDLDSTNGVLVNGTRVREQELALGDTITFGKSELRFERRVDETDPS